MDLSSLLNHYLRFGLGAQDQLTRFYRWSIMPVGLECPNEQSLTFSDFGIVSSQNISLRIIPVTSLCVQSHHQEAKEEVHALLIFDHEVNLPVVVDKCDALPRVERNLVLFVLVLILQLVLFIIIF